MVGKIIKYVNIYERCLKFVKSYHVCRASKRHQKLCSCRDNVSRVQTKYLTYFWQPMGL